MNLRTRSLILFFFREYCPLLKLFSDESTISTQTEATEQQHISHSWSSFHLRRPKPTNSPAPVPSNQLRGGSHPPPAKEDATAPGTCSDTFIRGTSKFRGLYFKGKQ